MKTPTRLILCPLLVAGLFAYHSHANAQSYWDPGALDASPGSGGSGTWSTGTNWWVSGSSDSTWTSGNIANFEGTAGTVTLSAAETANGLTFTTAGYTLAGSSILTLGGSTPAITVPTGSTTISAKIAGSSPLTESGSGTLALTGANAYTGAINISAGCNLMITTGGFLTGGAGIGPVTINGNGIFTLSNNAALANTSVTGGSTSTMNIMLTSANLWLTNSLANFLGTFNVNYFNPAVASGQLVVGSGAAITPNINSSAIWNIYPGAAVDFNGGQTDPAAVNLYGVPYAAAADGALRLDNSVQSGNVTLYGNSEIGNGSSAGESIISGVISDSGGNFGFVKMGAYQLDLQAANTYHGATIISNGMLSIDASGSIANSSGIALAAGTTFDVSIPGSLTLGSGQNLTSLGSTGTINGSLVMNAASSLTIDLNSPNPPINFTDGALTLNNAPVTVNLLTGGISSYTSTLVSGVADASTTSPLTVNGLANTSWTAGNGPSLLLSGGVLSLVMNFPVIGSYTPVTYSNLYVYVGGVGPTLTVNAVGNPTPSLQWYDNTGLLAGQTSSSYTTAVPGTPGQYTNYCVAQNGLGFATNFWVLNVIGTNSIAAYPLAVLSNNPVAYWRLDEPTNANGMTNGNAGAPCNDYIGGHDGYYTNVNLGYLPGYSPSLDPTESAAQFGSYATANSVVLGTSGINFSQPSGTIVNFSVEAWIKSSTATGSASQSVCQGEYGANDSFELAFNTAAARLYRFLARTADGGVHTVTSTVGPDGNWHYLVGVLDETDQKELLYLDGALTASGAITTTGLYTPPNLAVILGAGTSTGTSYNQQFVGEMSDVAMYSYALTPGEIQAHYVARGVAPAITLPATTTNVDLGAPLVLTAGETGTVVLTNSWLDSNANTVVSTTPTLSVTVTGNDKYILRVTNAYPPAASATLTVTTYSGAPSFASPGHDMIPTSAMAYVGVPVTFTVQAYGTYPLAYQWYKNGSAIAGATGPSYTATATLGTSALQCIATGAVSPVAMSQTATLVGIAQPGSFYSEAVLSNGPIAYWRLDEADNGSGNVGSTAFDYVGGHNAQYEATGTGVVLGQPGYNPADSDTCALFGTLPSAGSANSYAGEIDNSANNTPNIDFVKTEFGGNAEYSVEAWVKTYDGYAQNAGTEGIVARGYAGAEQFLLACHNDYAEFLFREANNVTVTCQAVGTGGQIDDGNWHHLVGVCDQLNATARLYVDGALRPEAVSYNGGGSGLIEPSGATLAAADRVSIGSYAASQTATTMANQWLGYIDEVALYTNALNATEIAQHYDEGTNAIELPYLISSVTFGAGTGVTLTWQSVPGVYYQVNKAASLVPPITWTSLGVVQGAASTNLTSFLDSSATSANAPGYYQVVGNVPPGGTSP